MILDKLSEFCVGKSVVSLSSDIIDLGSTDAPLGHGDLPYWYVLVTSALTGDLTVKLSTSDAESGTYTAIATATVKASDGVAGAMPVAMRIPNTPEAKRYLKIETSGSTAGKITSGISWGVPGHHIYKAA